jgi:hypothetical protein
VQVSVDAISRHSHLHRLTLSAPSGDMCAPHGWLLIQRMLALHKLAWSMCMLRCGDEQSAVGSVSLFERTACSDRELRSDELVLLTVKPPPASARSFKAPPLHAIALVERLERGGGRTELGAVVNMLTGDRGAPGMLSRNSKRELDSRVTYCTVHALAKLQSRCVSASREGWQAAGGAGQAAGAPDHVARHPHHVLDAPLPPVQGELTVQRNIHV